MYSRLYGWRIKPGMGLKPNNLHQLGSSFFCIGYPLFWLFPQIKRVSEFHGPKLKPFIRLLHRCFDIIISHFTRLVTYYTLHVAHFRLITISWYDLVALQARMMWLKSATTLLFFLNPNICWIDISIEVLYTLTVGN